MPSQHEHHEDWIQDIPMTEQREHYDNWRRSQGPRGTAWSMPRARRTLSRSRTHSPSYRDMNLQGNHITIEPQPNKLPEHVETLVAAILSNGRDSSEASWEDMDLCMRHLSELADCCRSP